MRAGLAGRDEMAGRLISGINLQESGASMTYPGMLRLTLAVLAAGGTHFSEVTLGEALEPEGSGAN